MDDRNAEHLASIEPYRVGEAYHVPGQFVADVGPAKTAAPFSRPTPNRQRR